MAVSFLDACMFARCVFPSPDGTTHLRQGVRRLRVEHAWFEQQFRDSRLREGGGQDEVRTASRTDSVLWACRHMEFGQRQEGQTRAKETVHGEFEFI